MRHLNQLIYISALCIFVFSSCKDGPKKEEELPGISAKEFDQLMVECDFIDYIFSYLPFSLSQDEDVSIKQNISFISEKPLKIIPKDCKPMARKFFQVKGLTKWEADVYFSDNCAFYVFIKDNKPIFANYMNEAGKVFYTDLINRSKTMQQMIQ